METVGSIDAENHLSQLLDRVAEGEEFIITRHGKPVAKLIPATTAGPKPDAKAAVEAMMQFRQGRSLGEGLTPRDLIEDGRRLAGR